MTLQKLTVICTLLATASALNNVALYKPVTSSGEGNYNSSKATDGDTKTNHSWICIETAYNIPSWWRVDLESVWQIERITIYFRTDWQYRRNGIHVYVTDSTQVPSGDNCYNVTGTTTGPRTSTIDDVLNITCSARGRYVLLYTVVENEVGPLPLLDFCEVQVYATAGCPSGMFGPTCNQTCHCHVETCHSTTGVCPSGGCQPGWQTESCDTECEALNYGQGCSQRCSDRHCKHTSASCGHIDGTCGSGCLAGWQGVDCRTKCSSGTYGEDCSKSCSTHCDGASPSTCDHVTGRCTCKSGYTGEDCTKACTTRTYGYNCSMTCSNRHCNNNSDANCHHVTGTCKGGCQPGWKETNCIDECSSGTYEQHCSRLCSARHCDTPSSGHCNHVTGACENLTCQTGWKGRDCIESCTENVEYGNGCSLKCSKRMCSTNSSCSKYTGQCKDGCLPGWIGLDCREVCPNGYFGKNCSQSCTARHCSGKHTTCNHVTGTCADGCSPGWVGPLCTQACTNGSTYGKNCSGNCSVRMCEDESSGCPQDSGSCDNGCKPGWRELNCTQECSRSYYGRNCSQLCTDGNQHCSACDHVTGTCDENECLSGWTGDNCTQEVSKQVQGPNSIIGPILGAVAALLVVVVVVAVVVVFLYRRRSRRHKHDNSPASGYEDNTISEGTEDQANLRSSIQGRPTANRNRGESRSGEELDNTQHTDYYNFDMVPLVTEVQVRHLEARVHELQSTKGAFEREYESLISGFTHAYADSQLPENKGKNRFLEYYPYDYNRVVLTILPNDPSSGYVNASYINGYSKEHKYIAAQAPNKKTVGDFWRMIYEKECTTIVMLTNLSESGKVKCHPYWNDDEGMETEHFKIEVSNTCRRVNWVSRDITATDKQTGQGRVFKHFQFITWPDHGTPEETALSEFVHKVRKMSTQQEAPLLVHCSAGIGRTGTYIAVDFLMDRVQAEEKVDVFRFVNDLRTQRRNMVQTQGQYECVYTTLQEALSYGDTVMSVTDFRRERDSHRTFKMGRMPISKLIQSIEADQRTDSASSDVKGRVWINGREDILVISMPSYLSASGYLLTEEISAANARQLWNLLEERDSDTVIFLPGTLKSVSTLVPSSGESMDMKSVNLNCVAERRVTSELVVREVRAVRESQGEPSNKTTSVYLWNKPPETSLPSLLDCMERIVQQDGENIRPVTVVHSDREKHSAVLFCVMSNILQRMRLDSEVEIYHNIREAAYFLQDITEADVSLCYDVASMYADSQSIYANV